MWRRRRPRRSSSSAGSPVITDNVGSQEMKSNGDSDAAAAMSRVTGLSLVDNQYVFVRGLGERYSNTTLAGSVLPTTEPDKKVVPLDLFPTGLIDSVQVNKSVLAGSLGGVRRRPGADRADEAAEPAGRRFLLRHQLLLDGDRQEHSAQPAGQPRRVGLRQRRARAAVGHSRTNKIVRQRHLHAGRRLLARARSPRSGGCSGTSGGRSSADGKPGQNWSATFGNRFGNLGVVASVTHSYKEQFVEEDRRFFRIAGEGELEARATTTCRPARRRRSSASSATSRTSSRRPSGSRSRTSTRTAAATRAGSSRATTSTTRANTRTTALQFIEEGLIANAIGGEHFFQGLSNSRLDWRVNSARATRDEPDLRETLYERLPLASTPNRRPVHLRRRVAERLPHVQRRSNDDTVDAAANWATFSTAGGRPTQYKFGVNYVERTRDFQSRRFHFIPITTQKADTGNLLFDNRLPPEELFTPSQHRHGVPVQRGDAADRRLRRRPDDDRPATAWSTSR